MNLLNGIAFWKKLCWFEQTNVITLNRNNLQLGKTIVEREVLTHLVPISKLGRFEVVAAYFQLNCSKYSSLTSWAIRTKTSVHQ